MSLAVKPQPLSELAALSRFNAAGCSFPVLNHAGAFDFSGANA